MNNRQKLEAFYLLMNTAPVLNPEAVELLLEKVGTPQNFWDLSCSQINQLDIEDKEKKKLIQKLDKHSLESLVKTLVDLNCNIVVITDDDYPLQMKKYKYKPLMLFYRGDISLLHHNDIIAMVGTRKSSMYGETLISEFIAQARINNYSLITGTAVGIDTKVLETSLNTGVKCISVLSSGIDCISPKKSEELLNKIVDNGGLYLTEFPPGVSSFKSNYPIRAKIIAILSSKVLVVEAPESSGAILVAEEAFKIGVNVFCPPSFNHDSNFWGSHNLIDSGKAVLISSFDDVINY